jgi:gas vesicle protein
MASNDTSDFLTAFAIGTALGAGAILLLRPARPNPRKRLAKRLKPRSGRKLARRSRIRSVRLEGGDVAAAGLGADATQEMTREVIATGRELLAEFRAEVQRILDEAREELRSMGLDAGQPPAPAAGVDA